MEVNLHYNNLVTVQSRSQQVSTSILKSYILRVSVLQKNDVWTSYSLQISNFCHWITQNLVQTTPLEKIKFRVSHDSWYDLDSYVSSCASGGPSECVIRFYDFSIRTREHHPSYWTQNEVRRLSRTSRRNETCLREVG